MKGWIRFEKDMLDDPRIMMAVARLPADLCAVTSASLMRHSCVTGALLKLWCYADRHIVSDDTLQLSVQACDEIVGVTGFCEAMSDDLVQVVDENTIRLPGYCAKNSLIVLRKRREAGNKRMAASRARHKVRTPASPSASLVKSDASQVCHFVVDQDQDKDIKEREKDARARAPEPTLSLLNSFEPNAEQRAEATRRGLDAAFVFAKFSSYHRARASMRADWPSEWSLWVSRELVNPSGAATDKPARSPEQIGADANLAARAELAKMRYVNRLD
jgi:hypothetical protein